MLPFRIPARFRKSTKRSSFLSFRLERGEGSFSGELDDSSRTPAGSRNTRDSQSLETLCVLVIIVFLLFFIFIIPAISIAFRSFGFDVVLMPRSCSRLRPEPLSRGHPIRASAQLKKSVLLTVTLHGCIPVDSGDNGQESRSLLLFRHEAGLHLVKGLDSAASFHSISSAAPA